MLKADSFKNFKHSGLHTDKELFKKVNYNLYFYNYKIYHEEKSSILLEKSSESIGNLTKIGGIWSHFGSDDKVQNLSNFLSIQIFFFKLSWNPSTVSWKLKREKFQKKPCIQQVCKIFQRINISYPLIIRTRTCAY